MSDAFARVEELLAEVEARGDEATRERTRELVASLLAIHGEALAKLVEVAGGERVAELARKDPAVEAMLVLHGVHPEDGRAGAMLQLERAPGIIPASDLVRGGKTRHGRGHGHDGQAERCEMCASVVADRHEHLISADGRELQCVCLACALRFDAPGLPWRRVATRIERLGTTIGAARWQGLGVPVGLAFFVRRSGSGRVSMVFPGPAGVIESEPAAPAWEALVQAAPEIGAIGADVEALLVDRTRGEERCWRVSIDVCWEIAAMFRASRGDGVWDAVEARLGA